MFFLLTHESHMTKICSIYIKTFIACFPKKNINFSQIFSAIRQQPILKHKNIYTTITILRICSDVFNTCLEQMRKKIMWYKNNEKHIIIQKQQRKVLKGCGMFFFYYSKKIDS